MKVDVYKNLHRNCFSVKSREKENYGKVVDHVDSIVIQNPTLVVQPAGRRRVLEEQTKNVHAFVRGCVSDSFLELPDNPIQITYNPYKHPYFYVIETGEKITEAKFCYLTLDGVFVYD